MQNDDRVLVLGASGFLGSHLVLRLAEQGRTVRAFVRPTSDCRVIRHLDIEWAYGDIRDAQSLYEAMQGVETVYHSIVDPRPWVRDVEALYEINVEGLKRALHAAEQAGVRKYLLTSTFGTIAPNASGIATEADCFDADDDLPVYLRSRVVAERFFLDFIDRSDMVGVAGCVGSTFGANDILPTPQGRLVADASRGRMPFYWDGGAASVGIRDAAEGMILAEHWGRSGERYILAERWLTYEALFRIAACATGRQPWLVKVPVGLLFGAARATELVARPLGLEPQLTVDSVRCMTELTNCSNHKAITELGWAPRPVEEAVREAVAFFQGADCSRPAPVP